MALFVFATTMFFVGIFLMIIGALLADLGLVSESVPEAGAYVLFIALGFIGAAVFPGRRSNRLGH